MTSASTNLTALFAVGAGSGMDSKNMVKTADMNDIGQLIICENAMHNETPSANRKILRLAYSAPAAIFAVADVILINKHKSKCCSARFATRQGH